MLEPENNPNPALIVDPPRLLRFVTGKAFSRLIDENRFAKKRAATEKQRIAQGQGHVVEYFHQLDDPYSHLTAQVVARFAARYDVTIVPHLIRATGGKHQPEEEKLAAWARRDVELVAPHYGLSFPQDAGVVPDSQLERRAAEVLAGLSADAFLAEIERVSGDMWSQQAPAGDQASTADTDKAMDAGSARLAELGHYSGAMFYYGGEWYWGVDRLYHLEHRLRELGACREPEKPLLVPRPSEEVEGVDASRLHLHFYPSLNSPYTAIIYDRTIALAKSCDICLHHKPVLPMVMRGVPAPPSKARYIFSDTKREGQYSGVPFGPIVLPIGTPTRQAYSLLPWAKSLGTWAHRSRFRRRVMWRMS